MRANVFQKKKKKALTSFIVLFVCEEYFQCGIFVLNKFISFLVSLPALSHQKCKQEMGLLNGGVTVGKPNDFEETRQFRNERKENFKSNRDNFEIKLGDFWRFLDKAVCSRKKVHVIWESRKRCLGWKCNKKFLRFCKNL